MPHYRITPTASSFPCCRRYLILQRALQRKQAQVQCKVAPRRAYSATVRAITAVTNVLYGGIQHKNICHLVQCPHIEFNPRGRIYATGGIEGIELTFFTLFPRHIVGIFGFKRRIGNGYATVDTVEQFAHLTERPRSTARLSVGVSGFSIISTSVTSATSMLLSPFTYPLTGIPFS